MQKKQYSIANALELCLTCIMPSTYTACLLRCNGKIYYQVYRNHDDDGFVVFKKASGGCLSIRMASYQYRIPIIKVKVSQPSYLYHGDPHTWKHGLYIETGPRGGWFNIKMACYQYRKSHCGDKTILRPSYLHNGISYTGKMPSLYWLRALISRASVQK